MKLKKVIAIVSAAAFIFTGGAFAAQIDPSPSNMTVDQVKKKQANELQIDPIKALQDLKANLQTRYTEGKISKEKLDNMNQKIDAAIKEIQEFNKLPVKEKKAKLVKGFTEQTDKRVQIGKL